MQLFYFKPMIKKYPINIFTFTGILFSVLVCSAFKPPKKDKETTQLPVLDKPINSSNSLLWQISGNGLSKPSYLYGTIHIIDQENYFLGKNVKKKIKQCDELVMELDMENIDVSALTKLSLLDSGKTIKNYMSDSDYAVLETFMQDSIGIKKYTFEMLYSRLKPFYIEQLIYFKYLGQEKESYEQNFKKLAETDSKVISGLETFEEQLLFLESIPLETQLKSLTETIKSYSSEAKKLDELIELYKKQDLNELSKLIEDDEDSVLNEKLLYKRNSNWIPKLQTKIELKSCFIAVGAGHLGGENGLINLLKKQGYTVEPISTN